MGYEPLYFLKSTHFGPLNYFPTLNWWCGGGSVCRVYFGGEVGVFCVGFGGGVCRVLWWCVGSWLCVCFSVCM